MFESLAAPREEMARVSSLVARGLSVEAPAADSKQPFDTRIAIVNRALKRADGSVPVRNVDVEFGWQPVALLLALILATPVSWRRRGWAVFWGLLGYHCFLLLSLDFVIWAESAEISLVTLTPFWKFFANEFKDMITGQTSLAVPVVIWMLIIFRREDRGMIFPAKLQTAA